MNNYAHQEHLASSMLWLSLWRPYTRKEITVLVNPFQPLSLDEGKSIFGHKWGEVLYHLNKIIGRARWAKVAEQLNNLMCVKPQINSLSFSHQRCGHCITFGQVIAKLVEFMVMIAQQLFEICLHSWHLFVKKKSNLHINCSLLAFQRHIRPTKYMCLFVSGMLLFNVEL